MAQCSPRGWVAGSYPSYPTMCAITVRLLDSVLDGAFPCACSRTAARQSRACEVGHGGWGGNAGTAEQLGPASWYKKPRGCWTCTPRWAYFCIGCPMFQSDVPHCTATGCSTALRNRCSPRVEQGGASFPCRST